jgi:hypothetical protein
MRVADTDSDMTKRKVKVETATESSSEEEWYADELQPTPQRKAKMAKRQHKLQSEIDLNFLRNLKTTSSDEVKDLILSDED